MPLKTLVKNVAAAGVAERLSATDLLCSWAIVQAKKTNGGEIYGPGPSTVAAADPGVSLGGGESALLPANGGQRSQYNLKEVWIDSSVNGEGVTVLYDALDA